MNQPILETERLLIREILLSDLDGMFQLDSNPKVHRYLGNQPVTAIGQSVEMIESIRRQYISNGIGRWAMVEKTTGRFIGWTGFKVNEEPMNGYTHFLDIGYRLIEEFWGKGYANESAQACMDYLCNHKEYDIIYGAATVDNEASNKILQTKLGMRYVNSFYYDGDRCYFYEITKEEWLSRK